jgi:alkylation response protein AidB-like acyl-CoA dehydrogenase|tara:strand:+ start:190181 stop:191392 length:1212 start_codon:yes stop_codon:yes gene_type:complete
MDLGFSPEEEEFRAEVRSYLQQNIRACIREAVLEEQPLPREWNVEAQQILNRAGYAVPHWPVEWGGRDWSAVKRAILTEEIDSMGVPRPLPFNVALIGPVIAAFGSEEQKRRFLPAIANLDMWFCQGFSEPDAGSDLASLKTSAVREGDGYRVNGQKTWTTYAQHADWIFCLVRTSREERKQQGISMMVMPMNSPGITVRPIRSIDGIHHINEVFLDDVHVPAEHLIGEEGRGWDYAKYLLGQERTSMGNVGFSRRRLARIRARASQTQSRGCRIDEPAFRRRLTWAEIELQALSITQMRVIDEGSAGDTGSAGPDPKTSILKMKGAEMLQRASELLLDTMGPEAMCNGASLEGGDPLTEEGSERSAIVSAYFGSRKYSIFGGSNEIQRNILAKAVLGLGKRT